jgi:succinate dehydrogenase/fumarate reductase flavoprotein subunit
VEAVDIVVIGTGAAGLTAAAVAADSGARVALFEKSDLVGGTTAWSGGQVWIPNNPHMAAVGVDDSRERAVTYIMSLSRGLLDQRLVEAYVDAGREMVEYLEARTPVNFYAVAGMPDYHPEFPGGSPEGGRTIECPIYSFAELGEWAERVTPSPYFANPHITMSETPLGKAVPDPPSGAELERRRERDERGCGQGLVGRLLRACLDRGVEPRTGWAARELLVEERAVVGVTFDSPVGPVDVQARRGVILGSGGFEWDPELCRAFLRGPMSHPVSVETNTGDGLRMAMKAGAMLSNMREAWWIPVAWSRPRGCPHGWHVATPRPNWPLESAPIRPVSVRQSAGSTPTAPTGTTQTSVVATAPSTAEATLGPLDAGPYYAVEIHSGCLGTKGGPQVDVNGQALDVDGLTIPGLYAAGNAMGSPFGMTYGGPGGTLGPAMVFGYIAALHAAGAR